MARQRWLLGLILSLTAASIFLLANPLLKGVSPLRLGLDLQGGSQITLQVKPSDTIKNLASPEGQKAVEDVERVIADRVNRLGVSEPLVQRVGSDKVLVQLAGIRDPYEAESILGRAAQLEFREQIAGTEDKFSAAFTPYRPLLEQEETLRKQIRTLKKPEDRAALAALSASLKKTSQENLAVFFKKTGIDGRNLKEAGGEPVSSTSDRWNVAIRFDQEGGNKFAEMTKRLAGTGRSIGVFLDETLISSPTVGVEFAQNGIAGGGAVITGNFTAETSNELAIQFKSGSLPVPIEIAENRIVGASLGQDSVRRSVVAAIGGITLVFIFMILYYRLPGAIASVALIIYSLLNLASFALLPGFVLTLPDMGHEGGCRAAHQALNLPRADGFHFGNGLHQLQGHFSNQVHEVLFKAFEEHRVRFRLEQKGLQVGYGVRAGSHLFGQLQGRCIEPDFFNPQSLVANARRQPQHFCAQLRFHAEQLAMGSRGARHCHPHGQRQLGLALGQCGLQGLPRLPNDICQVSRARDVHLNGVPAQHIHEEALDRLNHAVFSGH